MPIVVCWKGNGVYWYVAVQLKSYRNRKKCKLSNVWESHNIFIIIIKNLGNINSATNNQTRLLVLLSSSSSSWALDVAVVVCLMIRLSKQTHSGWWRWWWYAEIKLMNGHNTEVKKKIFE